MHLSPRPSRPCHDRRSCLTDVLDLLQSPTLLLTIGYGVLEALLGGLFPSLRPLVRRIHRGEGLWPEQ